ncbi:MAG: S9 family peptidase [Acidobacteriota bacterium]|nr:MAG: S9 family peptidase [Acidobacteriota bacterium]
MRRTLIVFLLIGLSISLLAARDPADSRPFSVQDLVRFDRISGPAVSPDGHSIVFVVRQADIEKNSVSTNLWLIDADGSGLRRLTAVQSSDSSPCWAPEGGSVYFLSSRSGSSQIWKISTSGGEAVQISDLPLDVGNLGVAPGGRTLVFSLEVFPGCETITCTTDRLKKEADRQSTGQLFDRLFIRHWDTWKDGRRSHLFSWQPGEGDPVDLMAGMDADSPSKPFGGKEEFTITPDGQSVIFTARDAGREEAWSTNLDLFLAPIDGSSPPRNLTAENKAWDTQPRVSPDGKMLAYLAMERPGFEADRFRIMIRNWPDGDLRGLTEDWDRSAGSLTWSPDSKTLYVTAGNLGQTSLFAVEVETGKFKTVVKEGTVSSVNIAGERIVFAYDHLKSPVELHSVDLNGERPKALTEFNKERLASTRMGDFEQFTFPGWNDETVYAYVVKPVDFDPSKKYPVAYLIHGGPQGSFGNHFHYRWNPQTYSGAGYAAVMVDFHGSTGYGQSFTDSITGNWGGKPFIDLQKGLDATLAKYPWMDGERVSALGASYGGYMINWIAGNWPDRFRCLVSHDGSFDERSMYFATEELWFPEWESGGTYWEAKEEHERWNPVNHVEKWKTPMLVIHGALDFRVPLEQGLATFTALQRQGIPSKFLYFPDENHWVLNAHNSILWHETVLSWLDEWTKR